MKKNLETFSKNIFSEKKSDDFDFFENTYFFEKNNRKFFELEFFEFKKVSIVFSKNKYFQKKSKIVGYFFEKSVRNFFVGENF